VEAGADGIACHVLGDDGTGQPIRYQGGDEPLTAEGEAALRNLIAAARRQFEADDVDGQISARQAASRKRIRERNARICGEATHKHNDGQEQPVTHASTTQTKATADPVTEYSDADAGVEHVIWDLGDDCRLSVGRDGEDGPWIVYLGLAPNPAGHLLRGHRGAVDGLGACGAVARGERPVTVDDRIREMAGEPEAQAAVGTMLAVDADHKVAKKIPCLSAEMVHPGWVRLVLEPDRVTGESTVTWWRVPADVTIVEWQPGGR
jgi:hypothetical protein